MGTTGSASTANGAAATSSPAGSGRVSWRPRATRAIVVQRKTQRPVQFEITTATRDAVLAWINQAGLRVEDFLFPSRLHDSPHLGTRQ